MQRQRLTAKELQRRYRNGERNFANVDLSGESLRGMNLKGINLSEADLSKTDIRGTRFVNATLQKTGLTLATAGLQRSWGICKVMFSLPLVMLLIFSGTLISAQSIAFFFLWS